MSLGSTFTAPARAWLEVAIRDVVHEALLRLAPVQRAELDVMGARVRELDTQLAALRARIDGVEAQLTAWTGAADPSPEGLADRVERGLGALAVLHRQLEDADAQATRLRSQVQQAHQLATSASATAEAAADGVTGLEMRLDEDDS